MVTFHPAVVQGRLAGLVEAVEDGRVRRRRRAMGTALAGIGRYRVLAGLAHGSLAGRGAVLVAGAGDAVALLPLLAEFPRDALVQAVLRFLLRLRPGDRICDEANDRGMRQREIGKNHRLARATISNANEVHSTLAAC